MERTVALKKLERLLGKKLGWRINAKAPTAEQRAEAQTALALARKERNELLEKTEARHKVIVEADAEYQQLKTAHRAARDKVDRLGSITRHFKITVGVHTGMFFVVRAEGDSWEDVIAKITEKKNPAPPPPISEEDRRVASEGLRELNKLMPKFMQR